MAVHLQSPYFASSQDEPETNDVAFPSKRNSITNFKFHYFERKLPIILILLGFISVGLIVASAVAIYYASQRPAASFSTVLEVTIFCGNIIGTLMGDVNAYLGIPYALPPIGDRRFHKPFEISSRETCAEAWKTTGDNCTFTLPATKLRNVCLQLAPVTDELLGDEDCLYLNVYVPRIQTSSTPVKLKPVVIIIGDLFYMYGGPSDYINERLFQPSHQTVTAVDAIHVTFTSRLGPLGYLVHPTIRHVNIGLHDQIAALRWVRQNIQAFGGDPLRVTLFAYGSGAASAFALSGTTVAKHLFQKMWLTAPPLAPPTSDLSAAYKASESHFACALTLQDWTTDDSCAGQLVRMWNWSTVEPWLRSNYFGLPLEPDRANLTFLPGVSSSGGLLTIDNDIITQTSWLKSVAGLPIVLGQTSNEVDLYVTPKTVRFWSVDSFDNFAQRYLRFAPSLWTDVREMYLPASSSALCSNEHGRPSFEFCAIRSNRTLTDCDKPYSITSVEDAVTRFITDIRVTCSLNAFANLKLSEASVIYRYVLHTTHRFFDPYGFHFMNGHAFHGWDAILYLRGYRNHSDFSRAASHDLQHEYQKLDTINAVLTKAMRDFVQTSYINGWQSSTPAENVILNFISNVGIKSCRNNVCEYWKDILQDDPWKFSWKA